jgi:large subunit ribosomal protein L6
MYAKELKIVQEATVAIDNKKVKVSGEKGSLEKSFALREIKIEKIENKIKVSSESDRRKVKSLVGTVLAHIRNMITGVTKGYVYRLKVVFSHFPVTVKVEGDKILIQNFLGERTPRIAKIAGSAKVEVKGQDISVSGIDLDDVGLTASSIEQATRIVGYDRRRFPDGIFLTGKE